MFQKPLSGETDDSNPNIILVGSPNVGKSVLFNALTGAYTTVSNYPGTSVEVSRGQTTILGKKYQVLDTPGMYSLMPITEEERVARDMLFSEPAHVVVHLIDARNLERMLPMTIQLVESGLPVVLAVNIIDEAERVGMGIDIPLLREKLGIPVVEAAFARKRGFEELHQAIDGFDKTRTATFSYASDLEYDINRLSNLLKGEYHVTRRTLALLLMQRDENIHELVAKEEGEHFSEVEKMVSSIVFDRRADLHLRISIERKHVCRGLLDGIISQHTGRRTPFSEHLSNLSMKPLTGLPILLVALYFGLYEFVGGFGAGTLVDFLEGTVFEEYLNPWAEALGSQYLQWEWLRELIVGEYGIFTLGIRYAVAIILPIVGTFFIAFSIIEDTGYFPRLALLVDRVFKLFGLSGRAVIPMVLGFGCDTMATMVTRTLESVRERIIATILLALAIPCSAQLGVIMALLSDVPGALAVWTICILLVFLFIGLLAAKLMPGEQPMFYMEIPPLRMPQLRNVLVKTLTRMHWYFLEIFPLFIIASVLLWAGKMSGLMDALIRLMEPVMTALGLPLQTAAVFILGFFRRDFGAAGLYDMQTSGMLTPVQLTVAAVTLTLFVPCVAQFLMMQKERGWKVSMIIFLFVALFLVSLGLDEWANPRMRRKLY